MTFSERCSDRDWSSSRFTMQYWVHRVWNDNFTICLLTTYCENAKSCQRILLKVHCNTLVLPWAIWFLGVPDNYTSECFFLLGRRLYKEAINYLFLFTWQYIRGWLLPTDEINERWVQIKEHRMVFQIYLSCSYQHLQANGTTEST